MRGSQIAELIADQPQILHVLRLSELFHLATTDISLHIGKKAPIGDGGLQLRPNRLEAATNFESLEKCSIGTGQSRAFWQQTIV
jgi:hypothetical protein